MLLRVRRLLLTGGAILIFLVLAGATYQGVATALERRQFPYPGAKVDAGGHQLHIYCMGEGVPTVVLEAPATGMSAAWGWVQPDVAARTRTCTYDRAGLGWSEAGVRPYDPGTVAEQLHTLLQHAREQPPFVLAGQGLGAAFVKLYASAFGDEVSAIVLVDPPGETANADEVERVANLVTMSPWLARAGVLRATRMLSSRAAGLPEPQDRIQSAFLNRPDHLTRSAREISRWEETVRGAAAAPIKSEISVIRIAAAGSDRLALLTDRGQAARVTAAIVKAVAAARNNEQRE